MKSMHASGAAHGQHQQMRPDAVNESGQPMHRCQSLCVVGRVAACAQGVDALLDLERLCGNCSGRASVRCCKKVEDAVAGALSLRERNARELQPTIAHDIDFGSKVTACGRRLGGLLSNDNMLGEDGLRAIRRNV
eukprot:Amastigsp_a676486_1099.p4 type:complete len:135 gc:universal Amastigsp_a676486_1099:728-324(-)